MATTLLAPLASRPGGLASRAGDGQDRQDVEIALGRRADYSLRAVLHLARHDDGQPRPARSIAEAMGVPPNWLPALLAQLVDAGILQSTPGRAGGHVLARRPADISLLDVVDAVEPDREPTCVLRGGPCAWEGRCAFHEPWAAAKQALRDKLAATTFADVVALDVELGSWPYADGAAG